MKKINKRLITISLLIITLIIFYTINGLNYSKHIQIKQSLVEHPENLPTKQTAINSSFGFKNFRADIYWLETVQYIGGNAIGSEYKKYLFTIIDVITELNPYFEHPYTIGQLLLPNYNQRYETLSNEEQDNHTDEAIILGLKGISNFCTATVESGIHKGELKIDLIKQEQDLQKIWTEDIYKNPCSEYNIPYYLAYVYYYYKKDPEKASQYYKIASTIDGSLSGTKIMAAIMSGKGGDREKAYFMFLNIAKFIETKDEQCLAFSTDLESVGAQIFVNKTVELNGSILKNIDVARKTVLGEFNEEVEAKILSDTQCGNYINKAVRELNLAYIEEANSRYEIDKGEPSYNAKELFEEGYMDYLPVDFQQYENQGIIYEYNDDIGNYDYTMGNYPE